MREAKIYYKSQEAGILSQFDNGSFRFRYLDAWFLSSNYPPISLSLPKKKQEYQSDFLFPFFYNMLPEGKNKQVVCKHLRIDKDDYFGLLMQTAKYDSIGAITVRKIEQ